MKEITGVTPGSFEPAIGYVGTKIPRFTFGKCPGTEPLLTTAMKSVGEAMAIGRTFAESLQKGLRSMETGLTGLNEVVVEGDSDAMHAALANRLRGGHRMSGVVVIDGLREIRADNNRITERVLALEQDAVVLPFDALRKTAGTGSGAGRQARCVER